MEHSAVTDFESSGDHNYTARKEANGKIAANIAKRAAQEGAHIVVFPEYAFIGFPALPITSSISQREAYAELFDEIPEPSGDVPCTNASEYKNAPIMVALSCAAKRSSENSSEKSRTANSKPVSFFFNARS